MEVWTDGNSRPHPTRRHKGFSGMGTPGKGVESQPPFPKTVRASRRTVGKKEVFHSFPHNQWKEGSAGPRSSWMTSSTRIRKSSSSPIRRSIFRME